MSIDQERRMTNTQLLVADELWLEPPWNWQEYLNSLDRDVLADIINRAAIQKEKSYELLRNV